MQDGSRRRLVTWTSVALAFWLAGAAGASVLTYVETHQDESGGEHGLGGTRFVAVSPDGDNAYASSETDSAVVVYARDHHTGALTPIQTLYDDQDGVEGIQGTSNLAISPDGHNVYAGGTFEGAIQVFARDPHSGLLTPTQVVRQDVNAPHALSSPVWTAVSPDGRNLYVTGFSGNSLLVFARKPQDGSLTFVQDFQQGVNGVDFLAGSFPMLISHDGRNVYVGALVSNAVTTFARDSRDGTLTPIQTLRQGVDVDHGLLRVRALDEAHDGRHIYIAGLVENSLSVYERDRSDGHLTLRQYFEENTGGVNGIVRASNVTSSPDGKWVFVAGYFSSSIGIFRRVPETGLLRYVNYVIEGADGISGLDGVISLDVSPDGKNLYADSFLDGAVVVFDIDDTACHGSGSH